MEGECPICLSDVNNVFKVTTSCKHVFCLQCFVKLKDFLCPLCRKDFEECLPSAIKEIIRLNSTYSQGIGSNSIIVDVNNLVDFPPLST